MSKHESVRKALALFGAVLICVETATAADKPLFIQLPDDAIPQALGAGGFTVAGNTYNTLSAFYWMPTVGSVPMGGNGVSGISADGRTFVGDARDGRGIENAAIWQGGREWRVLGSFGPNARPCDALLSSGYDVSDDGKVIVGLAWDGCGIAHGFRWEESGGMRDLGSTVAGRSSRANAISGDGSVIVGWQEGPTGFRQGVRWVNFTQELFRGPTGFVGEAHAANVNGSLVVGGNCAPLDPTVSRAWAWTPDRGVTCYPYERPINLARTPFNTIIFSTSDDGRVMGGASTFGLDSESLIWIDGEVSTLKDYLRSNGVPDAFQGWINTGFITEISRDGRTLAGYGAGPRTFTGFLVILPPLPPKSGSEAR